MTTICDWICAVRDETCGTPADDGIKQRTQGWTGQVDRATWGDGSDGKLLDKINSAEAALDQLFDENQSPSFNPADAGAGSSVDTSTWDTEKMGDEMCQRMEDAKNNICGTSPDHDDAGEKCHEARGILTDLKAQADPG